MHKTSILLTFLVLAVVLSTGVGDVAKIPASKAIYIDMDSLQVYNNTSVLKCVVQTGEKAGNTAASILQFNISGLNISDTDIGILVLNVTDVAKHSNATNLVVLMPMGSNWDENSGYSSLVANMEPILSLIQKKNTSQMEVSTNDGQVFDVSKILKEAKGDKVSFFLMAFSDKNYSVEFKSTKSDTGPCLLVTPYPVRENLKSYNNTLVLPSNVSMNINKTSIFKNTRINENIQEMALEGPQVMSNC
jgi:hypothetical protein